MRWFKHFNDARRNPKILAIERELGEAGYARAVKLLEIIASVGGTGSEFNPEIRLKDVTTSEEWLAAELNIPRPKLSQTCAVFSRVGLIDSRAWAKKIIRVPQMLDYKDEWSRRNSRAATEQLPSDSEATPSLEVEVEVDADVDAESRSQKSDVRRTAVGRRTTRLARKHAGLESKIKREDETIGSFLDSLKRDGAENPEWFATAAKAAKFCNYRIDVNDPKTSVSFVGQMANVYEKCFAAIGAGDLLPGNFCSKVLDACMGEDGNYPPSFGEHRDGLRQQERVA